MGKKNLLISGCVFAVAIFACTSAFALLHGDTPDARHAWAVQDWNRPCPAKVTAAAGCAPSDAIVLFDGTVESLSKNWISEYGGSTKWKVEDGALVCVPRTGTIKTKRPFGDFQLHVEWRPPRVADHLRCDDTTWQDATMLMHKNDLNLIVIDVGESLIFPSHPELAVKGSWSVERYHKELDRLRSMGLEPIPKLNFSTAHQAWLKEYSRMVSTAEYYRVCADVIRDTAEVFGNPRWFHIGFDEEMPIALNGHLHAVMRQGDLWWHDFLYIVKEVEKNNSRAWCWSDYIWTARAEFLRRMPKTVLQSNWYYRDDFSEAKLKWNTDFEKKGGWGETIQGAAAFLELEKAGYDQLPCTSSYQCEPSADAVVKFCRERIAPERLKGFLMAPWTLTTPDKANKISRSIELIAASKNKYYP